MNHRQGGPAATSLESQSVAEEGTGRFIGAVTAPVDLSPLLAQLNRAADRAHGVLFEVRGDELVIQAPGVTPGMKQSKQYAAIRDAMGTPRGRETE